MRRARSDLRSAIGEPQCAGLDQTVQYQRNRVQEGSLPEADLIRVQLEYQQVAINHLNADQEARRLVYTRSSRLGHL